MIIASHASEDGELTLGLNGGYFRLEILIPNAFIRVEEKLQKHPRSSSRPQKHLNLLLLTCFSKKISEKLKDFFKVKEKAIKKVIAESGNRRSERSRRSGRSRS